MSNAPTVLIVEDDPVFRRVLQFTVAKSGLQACTASNGEEGFQRLMQGGIDFLVTDLQMPICSGLDLLERISRQTDYQRPRTILCTAKGLELDTQNLIKTYDLVTVMHKPFSPRKLSDLIAENIASAANAAGTTPGTVASLIAPTEASHG